MRMAWRNIWRNRRRTILLVCAMSAGLVGVLFMVGLMNGWLQEMVNSSVRTYEGHVKILGRGYHDNPIIEHSMDPWPALQAALDEDPRVRAWARRVVVPALLSTPTHSTVVNIIAVDPAKEALVSTARDAVSEGAFLSAARPNQVLVGRRLAEKAGLDVGKKLVLMSQQWGGDLGSAAFRVSGLFESGMGGFDESHVYILLADAQRMLNLGDRLTELVVMCKDIEQSETLAADLAQLKGDAPVEVLSWKERMPLVVQYIELSDRFVLPYYAVFYIAMAFGIVNTMSMAIGERTYELGVMMALGMKRHRIVLLLLLEAVMVAIVAGLAGLALGGLLLGWLGTKGMDLSAFAEGMDYVGVGRVIYPELGPVAAACAVTAMFATAIVFSLIPAVRAARLVPVRALRRMT